jgi:hypothetical protein
MSRDNKMNKRGDRDEQPPSIINQCLGGALSPSRGNVVLLLIKPQCLSPEDVCDEI